MNDEKNDPRDFIDAVNEMYDEYIQLRRNNGDSITCLPDLREAIDRVEKEWITASRAPVWWPQQQGLFAEVAG